MKYKLCPVGEGRFTVLMKTFFGYKPFVIDWKVMDRIKHKFKIKFTYFEGKIN